MGCLCCLRSFFSASILACNQFISTSARISDRDHHELLARPLISLFRFRSQLPTIYIVGYRCARDEYTTNLLMQLGGNRLVLKTRTYLAHPAAQPSTEAELLTNQSSPIGLNISEEQVPRRQPRLTWIKPALYPCAQAKLDMKHMKHQLCPTIGPYQDHAGETPGSRTRFIVL